MITEDFVYFELMRLGKAILMLATGYFVSKYIQKYLSRFLPTNQTDKLVVDMLSKTLFYCIMFLVALMVASEYNIDITALIAAAGIFGVALGFAAKNSLSNIISGLFLLIEKPFAYNDFISVGEAKGKVVSMDFFAVKLISEDGSIIRIPHEVMQKKIITKKSSS